MECGTPWLSLLLLMLCVGAVIVDRCAVVVRVLTSGSAQHRVVLYGTPCGHFATAPHYVAACADIPGASACSARLCVAASSTVVSDAVAHMIVAIVMRHLVAVSRLMVAFCIVLLAALWSTVAAVTVMLAVVVVNRCACLLYHHSGVPRCAVRGRRRGRGRRCV